MSHEALRRSPRITRLLILALALAGAAALLIHSFDTAARSLA